MNEGTDRDESPAELALRSLASWLSAGGYNAPTVDAKVFEEKIRWGVQNAIDEAVTAERYRCAKLLDPTSALIALRGSTHPAEAVARAILEGVVAPADAQLPKLNPG